MRSKKLLSLFFWFTFGAFLSPSVPHIAYVFRAWEPAGAVGAENVFWWVVSYAIAISIDGTVIWLSHTAAVSRREKTASGGYLFGLWSFILFLTGFSWLINWMYAKHNMTAATTALSGAITENIAGIQMATITPVMVSMFPVLAIMFTLMADKVIATKVLTAQELSEEADRLEALESAQKRIDAYNQRTKKSFIQVAKDTVIEAKDAVKEVRNGEANPIEEIASEAQIDEPITDPIIEFLPVVEEVQSEQYADEYNGVDNDEDNEIMGVPESYPLVEDAWLAKDRKSASIDEIMAVTGQSKRRINKANLQRSSRNKDLILISSVLEWLKTAPKPEPKAQDTDPLPKVNGHRKVTQPLANLVEMRV
jgi:hypothetical protein